MRPQIREFWGIRDKRLIQRRLPRRWRLREPKRGSVSPTPANLVSLRCLPTQWLRLSTRVRDAFHIGITGISNTRRRHLNDHQLPSLTEIGQKSLPFAPISSKMKRLFLGKFSLQSFFFSPWVGGARGVLISLIIPYSDPCSDHPYPSCSGGEKMTKEPLALNFVKYLRFYAVFSYLCGLYNRD